MSSYRRRRYSRRSSNIGLERALQHIHEAEELSKELGGTDKDVKDYFFSLSGAKLSRILDIYGNKYGESAREYAQKTIPAWRSGRTKMSGMVAGRLFGLLPPIMPLSKKHELIETLWKKHGPRSSKRIRFGPESDEKETFERARSYLVERIASYRIPEPLEARFDWLSAGDVQVKQDLLNYFLEQEKRLVVEGLKRQVPVLLHHIKTKGEHTKRISHKIRIGKHALELLVDPKARAISLEDPQRVPPVASDEPCDWWGSIGCLTWIVIIALIKFFLDN
nr:hypothetical protein 3 [Desulfobacterales bacterium]